MSRGRGPDQAPTTNAKTRSERTTSLEQGLLLDLYPRRGQAPGLIRRLLPDPVHEEGWRRLTHQDLEELTPAELDSERRRLWVALGLVADAGQVPPWALERLRLLTARRPGRAA